VVLAEVCGHDAVGEQEVGVSHRVPGFLGNRVRGVAREHEFRPRARPPRRSTAAAGGRPEPASRRSRRPRRTRAARRRGDGRCRGSRTSGRPSRRRTPRLRVRLVGGVHRQVVEEAVGVPEAVEVVEVDVCDDAGVRKRDVLAEELRPEIWTKIEEEESPLSASTWTEKRVRSTPRSTAARQVSQSHPGVGVPVVSPVPSSVTRISGRARGRGRVPRDSPRWCRPRVRPRACRGSGGGRGPRSPRRRP